MATRPRLPETVESVTREVKNKYDYPTMGEAIRHIYKEAGYDV